MLTAEQSIDLMKREIQTLSVVKKSPAKAARKAMLQLMKRWEKSTDPYVNQDVVMVERIGQNLTDLIDHLTKIQEKYFDAYAESEKKQ